MKKYILFAMIIILVLFASKASTIPAPTVSTARPSPVPVIYRPYNVDDQSFLFASYTLKNTSSLTLIPNFSQKKSSPEVMQANQCALLTNGGFYSKDNKPIGLFVAGGKQINAFQRNTLFNGFFSVNANGDATINNQIPDPSSRLALQSGPIVISNGIARILTIRDDEPARRIVIAQTNNTIIFLALFSTENTFEGPAIAEIPKHVKMIEKLLKISITNALNLDGGSASAFITKDVSLTELTPVGSFFCAK